MKVLAIFFLVVFFVLNIAFGIANGKKASKAKGELDGERYGRMLAEEELESAKSKIGSLERDAKRQDNKIKSIERLLEQTAASNKDLKARVTKMDEKKIALELRIVELEQIIVQKVPIGMNSGM